MLSYLVVRKSHYFSHNLHYYNTILHSLAQTTRLVPVLMWPKIEMCCDWLADPVRCDWRTAYTAPPPRQSSKFVNIGI